MSKPEVILTLKPERVQLQAIADQLPEWSVAEGGQALTRTVPFASVGQLTRFIQLLGVLGLLGGTPADAEVSDVATVDATVGLSLTLAPSCQPTLAELARALDRVSADFIP